MNRLMEACPDKVGQNQGDKTRLLGFFAGQVMRTTQGKANPQFVQEIVREMLG